jgi:hypothetical protein
MRCSPSAVSSHSIPNDMLWVGMRVGKIWLIVMFSSSACFVHIRRHLGVSRLLETEDSVLGVPNSVPLGVPSSVPHEFDLESIPPQLEVMLSSYPCICGAIWMNRSARDTFQSTGFSL